MVEWSLMDREWPLNQFDPYQFQGNFANDMPEEQRYLLPPPLPPPPAPLPAQEYVPPAPSALAALLYQQGPSTSRGPQYQDLLLPPPPPPPKGDNPREIRNKAEKQRRDKLNQSIGELATMVPPVVAASRKIDKTGVLRLTAHYLRGHQYGKLSRDRDIYRGNRTQRGQFRGRSFNNSTRGLGQQTSRGAPGQRSQGPYCSRNQYRGRGFQNRGRSGNNRVFGDAIAQQNNEQQFSAKATRALLSLFNGFLLTTTYRGLIVVVSQNVQQYLGYTELDLLGQNVLNIVHEQDRQLMRSQLMPKSHMLGPNGELLVPDEPKGKKQVAEELACEKRRFIVRFKKLGQRSEPNQYVTCHVEGSLRKSDRACRGYNRCCQMVRRARARGDNPCSSGNDVVFVGVVRLATETFMTESRMESYRMEYRTRHSIDGQIIQTEQRISLVTGYMTHEVNGINAMNFMHRDDVRWVVIALRSMYDQHRLVGESCYRLMAKNGQFIYLKTRGHLEVDTSTRAVTSFVCTNTMVDEQEGNYLIKLMKSKLTRMVNNNEEPLNEIEESKEVNEQTSAVEDPRQLKQVILHLVTDLPSPQSKEELRGETPEQGVPPSARLAIIPPRKERIVSAIEKIYSVIKTFPKSHGNTTTLEQIDSDSETMTYRQPWRSRQIRNDQSSQNAFTEPSDNAMTQLPNFNEVYQRRHSEGAMSIQELSPYKPPVGARTSTTTMPDIVMPSNSYAGLATMSSFPMTIINNNSIPSLKDTTAMKYHFNLTSAGMGMPAGPSAQPKPAYDLCSLPGPNTPIAGTKRPREYTDLDVVTKKKTVEPEVLEQGDNDNALDASFLDEALTSYPHIETAMSKLEQALDPAFPDLLVTKDVEDILHALEGPSNNKADL